MQQNQSALVAFVAVLFLQNKTKTWPYDQNLTLYVTDLQKMEKYEGHSRKKNDASVKHGTFSIKYNFACNII